MDKIDNICKIRPAGRHIITIGRDLIKDKYAAIVELVKNAYDADSAHVNIILKSNNSRSSFEILIEDFGHGMSMEKVINNWLVPSADDKMKRRISPGGRIMQGRKGVGRYAASILEDDLLLETIAGGKKTTVYIEWSNFENSQYLDEVDVLVETENTDLPTGTRLIITGGNKHIAEWNMQQLEDLKFELRKLISPVRDYLSDNEVNVENFRIHPVTLD